jgi:predicted Rossmann fold flavoprotein
LNKSIIIIGAGASGMFSSILLAKKGFMVTVLEKNTKPGRKILATGNGKCNVTNKNLSLDNFHSSVKSFPEHALSHLSYQKLENYFFSIGLSMVQGNGTKMYPMSLQASSVTDVLFNEAVDSGVKFVFNSCVSSTSFRNDYFEVYVNNIRYSSNILIIASGTAAMKKLGSSNDGYDFAQSYGHKIISTFASLVQLESNDKSIYELSGVKAKAEVKLYVNNTLIRSKLNDILFTSYGISGNAVLELSREASNAIHKNQKVEVIADILPTHDKEEILILLEKLQKQLNHKEVNFLLESIINKKLIKFILKKANINKEKISQLNEKDLENIVHNLKNIKISISQTKGYDSAEVCAGGIDVKDIDNKTMESKLRKNLYFCGEVMDVDGECGGFNLQWAWASSYAMANAITQ